MKRFIYILLMLVCTLGAYAQVPSNVEPDSVRNAEFRKKIGIDYSIPDFDTKKVDGSVIGFRLAKMLEFLQKNYTQGTYNRQLAKIRFDATEDPKVRFLGVDKLKIIRIMKEGDVIRVRLGTMSKNDAREKLQHEFDLVFDKGLSNSERVNALFADMGRYVKFDE